MKLLFFYILWLWTCIFAQNEFEQEAFENNADFGSNKSEESSDINNINVATDFIETPVEDGNENTYNADAVETNVDLNREESKQSPTEVVSEFDVDNGEYIETLVQIGIESIYNHGNTETVEKNVEFNQEQNIKTDFSEVHDQNVVHDPVETERNPSDPLIENESNNAQRIAGGTDSTEIQSQNALEQNHKTENVEPGDNVAYNSVETEEHYTEVVPNYEVDNSEHGVGIDPTQISTQGQAESQKEYNAEATDNIDAYNPVETKQNPTDKVANKEHVLGTDLMEVLGLPASITHPNLRVTIRYSMAGPRILVIDLFVVGDDRVNSIYHTEWTEMQDYPGEAKTKILRVTLPDSLVYKEDKILRISPDLHSESLLFRAAMVDYTNPSVLLLSKEQSIILTPPWSRLPKYRSPSCDSWIGMFFKNLTKNEISKCPKIDDVVELLSSPVALVGNEYGFKKFFQTLPEPRELLNRFPQFTIATWLYLTKRCSKDMCPLIYHIKGTAYQTPLIGLLKTGHLHLQFHYEEGNGFAFLVDAQIPTHKWIHITVTIKHTVVYVYVRHGKRLEYVKTFVHSDFPDGLYHYNDTDGYWGLGGSPGFISTHGFIGPARIYRRHVLSQEAVENIFTAASRPNLGMTGHFRSCRKLKSTVNALIRKKSKANENCPARGWFPHSPSLFCNVGVQGLATEIVQTVINKLKLNKERRKKGRDDLYNHAFNLTKSDKNNVKDVLPLLSYTSCLGHPKSLYLLSVLHRTGLGVNMDIRVSQRSLLLGAYYNHPLSQMSLAYKHYIGVDGLRKDHEVASTYYRYAAVQTNRILAEHNEVDAHSEAVRLDKEEDLDRYRGPNSNWFSWLKYQAKRGVTDAQSALGEMFYYGSRGFRRNLTKAAEFYEMGANRGDSQMLFNLGVVKLRGQGVDVNAEEAQELLKKSAQLGFAPAYNALGYYELNVRQNKSAAVEYFRLAAEHEDRDGLYNLGFSLENGLAPGTAGDLKSAMPYYISAANKGHTGACVVAGDAFSAGQYVGRDIKISIIFYKFVADQNPEIGLHLRSGLDGYFENDWYQSLLYYLLAGEAGMEIAQYNAALLCEWDWEGVSQSTQVDCAWRYYNHSAKQEWVPSLLKSGDNHWYGITAEKNITAAAQLYSQAATKEQNPQAIYNLGYLVENNYPLDGLAWMHFHPSMVSPGNLTLAAVLYRKCRDTGDEALVPCSLGLVRVAVKMAWKLELVSIEILVIPLMMFIISLALLYYLCRLNNDRQMIDLA